MCCVSFEEMNGSLGSVNFVHFIALLRYVSCLFKWLKLEGSKI